MARCAGQNCGRWRPDALVRRAGIGIQIDETWYCSTPCLEHAVHERLARVARVEPTPARALPPCRLGVLLRVGDRALTGELVGRALDAQRASGRRLGDELRRMGAVTAQDVLHALARQANTRYLTAIDTAIVREGHGNLSRDMVRALGLVPFEADEQTRILKVAYMAPLPRVALEALRQLSGWTPEPYLVADEVWPALVDAYGTSAHDTGVQHGAATAETLGHASARVVRAAGQGRSARISQARIDPYVWVRVETSDQVEDVLVTTAEVNEDKSCPMEHTSH